MIDHPLSLKSLLMSVFILGSFISVAQTMDSNRVYLHGDGRIFDQKAVIRWIPSDTTVWMLGNLYGYRILRIDHTAKDATQITALGDKPARLIHDTLRPLQPNQWQALSDSLPLASTAAAIMLAITDTANPHVLNDSETAEDFFGMAMLLADIDPAIACGLGVGFVDTNIITGNDYTYQVTINGHPSLTTSIKCHHTKNNEISPPERPEAVWGDLEVTLSWKATTADSCYALFWIEKSTDGGRTFEPANTLPIIPLYTEATREAPVKYTDSLISNDLVHHYRLKGVTPFGQYGPPSLTISGKGVASKIPLIPLITFIQHDPLNDKYQVGWDVDTTLNAMISGFEVHEYAERNTLGRSICADRLSPNTRTLTSAQFKHGYYYAVVAVDQSGKHYISTKKLLLKKDDQPPLPPTGLRAQIDTLGNAILLWSKNTEEDLMGYRVYISHQSEGPHFELTANPISDTFFLHKYPLGSLLQKLYFSIRAIDLRGNYSQHSLSCTVEIPDKIPPSAPVFNYSRATNDNIKICWFHSSSQDVVQHQLQRTLASSNQEEGAWHILTNYSGSQRAHSCFEDSITSAGMMYKYRILVIDATGHTSYSDELYVETPYNITSSCLMDLRIEREHTSGKVLLEWTAPSESEANQYIIYSAEGKGTLQSRAVIKGESGVVVMHNRHFKFVDFHAIHNQSYQYQIAAKDKTGQIIDLSPIISITL